MLCSLQNSHAVQWRAYYIVLFDTMETRLKYVSIKSGDYVKKKAKFITSISILII